MNKEEYRKSIDEEMKRKIEDTTENSIRRKMALDSILNKENILRQEKAKLQGEQKWYKKPQNIIMLLGVLLPIIVSIMVSVATKDSKELSLFYSMPEPLISDSDNMKESLYVRYDDTEISNISKFTIQIINSGKIAITSKDFIDGPICFSIKGISNPNMKLLKVIRRNDANQQSSKLILNTLENTSFQYLPSLINEGDEIILDVFLPNSPDIEFNAFGKIIDGVVNKPELLKGEKFDIGFKTFVLSIKSFFKIKWIAAVVLIVFFILTALASLFQISMLSDGELELIPLGVLMIMSTSVLSIFLLVVTIFVIIY